MSNPTHLEWVETQVDEAKLDIRRAELDVDQARLEVTRANLDLSTSVNRLTQAKIHARQLMQEFTAELKEIEQKGL